MHYHLLAQTLLRALIFQLTYLFTRKQLFPSLISTSIDEGQFAGFVIPVTQSAMPLSRLATLAALH